MRRWRFRRRRGANAKAGDKPIKVKEYNKVVFSGTEVRSKEFYPEEARVDLLRGPGPGPYGGAYGGGAQMAIGHPATGYGPYGDGFYGYAPAIRTTDIGIRAGGTRTTRGGIRSAWASDSTTSAGGATAEGLATGVDGAIGADGK